jgi:hypothetical protein
LDQENHCDPEKITSVCELTMELVSIDEDKENTVHAAD